MKQTAAIPSQGQWLETGTIDMSKAYRLVFECPKGGHDINFQRKCSAASLSDAQAMKMFGNEHISCADPNCGWHGKAFKTRLLRILPFYWLLSPTA